MYGKVFRGFPYGAWRLGWRHIMTPVINIRHDLGIKLQIPLTIVTVTQDWTLCRFLYASWISNGRRWTYRLVFFVVSKTFFFVKKPCGTVSQAFPLRLYPSFHLGVRDFFVQQAHWNSWELKCFVIPKQLRAAKGRWMIPPFPLVKFGRWQVPWIWGRKWRLVPWMMDDLDGGWFWIEIREEVFIQSIFYGLKSDIWSQIILVISVIHLDIPPSMVCFSQIHKG